MINMCEAKIETVKKLFEKVQKVPFFLLKRRDSKKLFKKNKGCCAEKSIWLGNKLKELKIPVKFFLMKFMWKDLPIPSKILRLNPIDYGYHLVVKAKICGKWIWIDPTWDPPLEKVGFPVTKNWDGKRDTKLAVRPLEIKEFEPEDPTVSTLDEKFRKALNRYLESVRKKN